MQIIYFLIFAETFDPEEAFIIWGDKLLLFTDFKENLMVKCHSGFYFLDHIFKFCKYIYTYNMKIE